MTKIDNWLLTPKSTACDKERMCVQLRRTQSFRQRKDIIQVRTHRGLMTKGLWSMKDTELTTKDGQVGT